jgi:hypothetical protein
VAAGPKAALAQVVRLLGTLDVVARALGLGGGAKPICGRPFPGLVRLAGSTASHPGCWASRAGLNVFVLRPWQTLQSKPVSSEGSQAIDCHRGHRLLSCSRPRERTNTASLWTTIS